MIETFLCQVGTCAVAFAISASLVPVSAWADTPQAADAAVLAQSGFAEELDGDSSHNTLPGLLTTGDLTQTGDPQGDRDGDDDARRDFVKDGFELVDEEVESLILTEPADSSVSLAEGGVTPSLGLSTHVSKRGWRGPVGAGQIAGTTGEALAVEALVISLSESEGLPSGGIEYRAHVQGIGWQGWTAGGQVAGTTGQARRVEALRIRLTGALAEAYDVYYQAHISRLGWMALAKNGGSAGSVGQALRVEALRVWIVPHGGEAPQVEVNYGAACLRADGLLAKAHSQSLGWLPSVGDGEVIGSIGLGKRLEALTISASNLEASGSVEYQVHVQGTGWQDVRHDGEVAGTTGRGRRIEALRVSLSGELGQRYAVWYRVHVSSVGWLEWTRDWGLAGSEGLSLPIEAVQVLLVAKQDGQSADAGKPVAGDVAFGSPSISGSSLVYASYVQGEGWGGNVAGGQVSGSTGRGLRLEGLRASVSATNGASLSGGITYRAHVQGGGWQSWSSDGVETGLPGQGKRVEAIQVSLTGMLPKVYNVWYRAHVQGLGWLGWTSNGQVAGSTGLSKRLEALQICLVARRASAPGSTANAYLNPQNFGEMASRAQGYSSPTGQLVMVNLSSHQVGVFTGSRGSWMRIRDFPCSSGAPNTPTVRGVFSIGSRGYSFGSGFTCYYWTQFYGDYLFHSIKYNQGTFQVQDGRLGMNISHGCVRMAINDARWINENVRSGTTVVVY